jgi:hypothetical protein
MVTITIENKRFYHGPGIYIGRPSPLGNPFIIGPEGDRAEVIAKYAEWLPRAIAEWPHIQRAFARLVEMARHTTSLTLICWCTPAACHGQVLRDLILTELEHENRT